MAHAIRSVSRTDAARDRLLQAALRAIAAKGFHGSSLAAIAADAGLTTAGLLHHFHNKEHLLESVLAEHDRLDGERFHLRDVQGLDALDRLGRIVRQYTQLPGLMRAFTVLLGEGTSEAHPARDWFADRYPRRRADLAVALRGGVANGQIRADVDCDALAAQIIAMMDGLQVQWVLNPDQVDMAAVFDDYLAGVRAAVSVRG